MAPKERVLAALHHKESDRVPTGENAVDFELVERIIGHKPGTGGSSGVAFLKKALDIEFFPELLRVRTEIDGG